jgi:hypothetical protein
MEDMATPSGFQAKDLLLEALCGRTSIEAGESVTKLREESKCGILQDDFGVPEGCGKYWYSALVYPLFFRHKIKFGEPDQSAQLTKRLATYGKC